MLERLLAEISLLTTQMENQPHDKHEIYLQLREKLNEMKATGIPPAQGSREAGTPPGGGVQGIEKRPLTFGPGAALPGVFETRLTQKS